MNSIESIATKAKSGIWGLDNILSGGFSRGHVFLVEGAPVSQAMRAVVAADFCNGTSAALDFRQWTFINADLTVSFARQPVGEWILLDAESWIGPDGAGLATARLADVSGYFGRAVQSLVIEKR